MPLAVFRVFSQSEFIDYILKTDFSREIRFIQNHHTYSPSYRDVTASHNEMYWLESMRGFHIRERKWSDIGQNITTFPSGNIGLCRPINLTPAGIYGANTGAICIEHLGNFDEHFDVMTDAHRDTVIKLNAVLCVKFGLKPVSNSVVYHHWYDTSGRRFDENDVNSGKVLRNKLQKTCPGTNFFHNPADLFKGNTILSAVKNFYPLIEVAMPEIRQTPVNIPAPISRRTTAGSLNVRKGRGTEFAVIRTIPKGTLVNVYESVEGWSRVNADREEWVNSTYLA